MLAISMAEFTEVTPGKSNIPVEEAQALEKAEQADTKRRSNIKLEAIGLQLGAVLTLSRGDDVHATVVSGNRVEYDGETMSLSKAALSALHKLGYTTPAVSGSDYWMYDGKTLDEIRVEKEAESVEEQPDNG